MELKIPEVKIIPRHDPNITIVRQSRRAEHEVTLVLAPVVRRRFPRHRTHYPAKQGFIVPITLRLYVTTDDIFI